MSIVFMIVLFVLILSFLVFVHELGHFLAAKFSGVWVKEFSIGFPPHIFRKKYGETEYKIGLVPIGGYVNLYGENGDQDMQSDVPRERAFNNQSGWKKLLILSGGVIMNLLTAIVLIALVIGVAGQQRVVTGVAITEVFEDGPAEQAGLIEGDIIIQYGLNESTLVETTDTESLITFIKDNLDREIVVVVTSDLSSEGVELFKITPVDFYDEGVGSLGVRIGLVSAYEYTDVPWYMIPITAVEETVYLFNLMFESLGAMLQNLTRGIVPEDVAGPVGIAVVSADVAKQGIIPLLHFIALISLNLALVNILPFPALDGGRIVFVLLEMVLGRSLDGKVQNWINIGGFLFLIGLIVLITIYDVVRFF